MNDKVIVITGASEGLGKVVATKLANEGAIVPVIAQNEDKLTETANQIGNKAIPFVCDISVPAQVRSTVDQIMQRFGRVDILINCAGIWTDENLEVTNPERRRRVLEVNAFGTIEFTKALEPTFRAQNHGHILNVISTSGTDDTNAGDNILWQTYGASKWAVAGFTRALRDALSETRIKVTGFYPGGFESNLYENANRDDPHDQPWMMKTEDVADALIYCLTRPSDMLIEKIVITKVQEDGY